MTNLVIDIETLPSEDEAVRAEIAAGIQPPGKHFKAETIAAWEAEKKPALVQQAILKTSFDGAYGRICCIGWAVDDEDPQSVVGSEPVVIEGFVTALTELLKLTFHGGMTERPITFIGHNLTGFDLRFLWQRAVINKIKLPSTLLSAVKAKPWDKNVFDTMIAWNPSREKSISLDKLCRVLGVETSKNDMDGSKVYETYKAGELDKIATYCREDVLATRECFQRMT